MGSLYSADIALLLKVSELARRHGLRPSEANARIDLVEEIKEGVAHPRYELSIEQTTIPTLDKFLPLADALGLDNENNLKVDTFEEIEDAVDRALSLAPRARTR